MTLRARIYFLVALAVTPAFVLLALDHQRSILIRQSEAEQQALRSAWLVSGELEQIFKGIESLLRAASQTPMVTGLQNPDCSTYLRRLERINPNAGSIIAVDGTGTVKCASSGATGSVADRDYFTAALESNDMVVGTYTIGRSSGLPVLPLAIKIMTVEGPGVLVAGVRLDWLRGHFGDLFAKFPSKSSLTIGDRNGTILVRLPNPDREGQPLQHYDFVVKASQPGVFRSTAEKNVDGIARFLGFTPIDARPRGVAIAVGYPQEAALSEVRSNAVRNYLLLGLAAILAFGSAAAAGRAFIQRPMSELLTTIERWRQQDMTTRVSHTSIHSEFGQLGNAFNSLADDLEAALKHKDVLLRELSHRVMNSLQTISSLFRLQSKSLAVPAAAAAFEQAISRIDAVARAYQRMQAVDGEETVEFGSLLVELCNDVQASLMNAPCRVQADSVSIRPKVAIPLVLIANELLTNAIKHSSHHDEPVVIEFRRLSHNCRLAVRNSGVLPEGRVANSKGFGSKMILAMVSQIHGDLTVSSRDGQIEFAVTFPPEVSLPMVDDRRAER
jgi:two-component sensor histidine kinase